MTEPNYPPIDDNVDDDSLWEDIPDRPDIPPPPPTNLLYELPQEIRNIIWGYVFHLPFDLQLDDRPTLWSRRYARELAGISCTSWFIYRESSNFFYRENTFEVRFHPVFLMYPSPRICDRIQNLTIDVSLSSHSLQPWVRFIGLIDQFGDPAIIRGTFSIHFQLSFRSQRPFCPNLNWLLQCLRRFANFRLVNVDLMNELETELITAMHYSFVENALGPRLGPATRHATGIGLAFSPQRFLHAQRLRRNADWMDLLDGIRIDSNQDDSADGSEPGAQ